MASATALTRTSLPTSDTTTGPPASTPSARRYGAGMLRRPFASILDRRLLMEIPVTPNSADLPRSHRAPHQPTPPDSICPVADPRLPVLRMAPAMARCEHAPRLHCG